MSFDLGNLLNSGSFDNFWYWAIIAVTWSRATHFLLGAGLHDVRDALKNGGQDMIDVETLININARKFKWYLVILSLFSLFTIIIGLIHSKFQISIIPALVSLISCLLSLLINFRERTAI